MKRSEMISFMAKTWKQYCKEIGPDNAGVGSACRHLLTAMEKEGMLPPIAPCGLVEDTYNGGLKHGPTERRWEDET